MPLTRCEPAIFANRHRSVVVLALLGLLWAQVVLAEHQADHRLVDLNDRCAVCLQLDRNDHALTGETARVAATAAGPEDPVTRIAAPPVAGQPAPRPRGPPVS